MVEGNSGVTVKEKNSENISPMVSQKAGRGKMPWLNMILMGLGFRLKKEEKKSLWKMKWCQVETLRACTLWRCGKNGPKESKTMSFKTKEPVTDMPIWPWRDHERHLKARIMTARIERNVSTTEPLYKAVTVLVFRQLLTIWWCETNKTWWVSTTHGPERGLMPSYEINIKTRVTNA